MKIDLLCSDPAHPVNAWLMDWAASKAPSHEVVILRKKDELTSGDVLFLISCIEMIPEKLRNAYRHCIVLHASDLPKGRGWSPHVWAILEGAAEITVSAINAEDKIDSGAIWAKRSFSVAPHELSDEINTSLFSTEIELMNEVLSMIARDAKPKPQMDQFVTYYPRRTPSDSELDPNSSLAEQFNKIRICDPQRYPAFFSMHGYRYAVSLKKIGKDAQDDN